MTRKNSQPTSMDKLKRLVPCLAMIALLAVPCHAESEWPQANTEPAMTDPSHPDSITEIQPLSFESPPSAPPAEVPAAVEAPAQIVVPPRVPSETAVPVEVQAEIPAEATTRNEAPAEVPDETPAAEETSPPSWPVPEEVQPQPPDNPIVPQKP